MSQSYRLILLPGLDGTGLLFRSLLAVLPPDLAVTVIDYPGDQCLDYESLYRLMIAKLPPSEPFILLGESFSGPLAVLIASRAPKNLVGLILCASFVTNPLPRGSKSLSFFIRSPLFWFYIPFKRVRAWFGGGNAARDRATYTRMQHIIRAKVIAFRIRLVLRCNFVTELEAIRVPILYLCGAKDRLVPIRNLALIRKYQPQTKVALIDSSHMVLQKSPEQALKAINAFAADCMAATAVD